MPSPNRWSGKLDDSDEWKEEERKRKQREAYRRWRSRNLEKERARDRARYTADPEKHRADSRRYRKSIEPGSELHEKKLASSGGPQ